jgi:hypothetical protein
MDLLNVGGHVLFEYSGECVTKWKNRTKLKRLKNNGNVREEITK